MIRFPGSVLNIYGSGETDMNQSSSLQNYENRIIYEGPPPQGLSETRRAGSFFEFLVSDPPRGHPVGVAVFIVADG